MGGDKDMNGGPPALCAHILTIEEAQVQLETDLEEGLASSQIPPRAEKWGRNELDD
ncbi:P-type ATPase [Pseudogymnoascus australis]